MVSFLIVLRSSSAPGLDVLQKRVPRVLLGQDELAAEVGPFDSEGGVVEPHAALGFPAVEVVALVAEQGVVLKYDEPVREAARHEELPPVLGRERHRHVNRREREIVELQSELNHFLHP